MKRHLVYLLAFLCCALVSCKDNENKDEDGYRTYPEEPQTPFQVTNRKGMLVYEELIKEWRIYPYSEVDGETVDTIYCVKDMPEDFQPQAYKDITFSGEVIYLYYEQAITSEIMHYCSINISEISHDVSKQTRTVNLTMECLTPASDLPYGFLIRKRAI